MARLALALGALAALAAAAHGFMMGGGMPGMMGGMPGMMGGMPGGFGGMRGGYGGMRGGGGYGGYDRDDRDDHRRPEFLTCIHKDDDDLTSQVRLTLTRNMRRKSMQQMGHPGMPMQNGMDDMDDDDDDDSEFRVDGTFVPGMGGQKVGSYRVVLTQFGRVSDGCSAQSLGPVLSAQHLRRRGGMKGGMGGHPGMGMMGGMGGLGMMGGMGGFHPPMNRMGQNFWKGGPQRAVGEMTNAAIIGTSATVYSDHLEGISKNQLVGRGMALCRGVRDGHCLGKIPYCCTIGRDNLPAMEMAIARRDDGFGGGFGGYDEDDGFGNDNTFSHPLGGGGGPVMVGVSGGNPMQAGGQGGGLF